MEPKVLFLKSSFLHCFNIYNTQIGKAIFLWMLISMKMSPMKKEEKCLRPKKGNSIYLGSCLSHILDGE